MTEERSQGLRGSRLNQWPLLSVRTRRSWSLAWKERWGDGGVFPGRQGTDREVEAGGGMFVESLVVTMEMVVAAAGSEVLWVGEDDATEAVALGVLPFCLTWGFSFSSTFTVSLPTSWPTSRSVHSLEMQPGCW